MALKLKDYKQMEIDRVYLVGNLFLVFDGVKLLSKYPSEIMWHPFSEFDDFFIRIKDRELSETDKFMS